MTEGTLYRVVTDTFVAGAIIQEDRVVHAAPILRRLIGRSLEDLRRWAE